MRRTRPTPRTAAVPLALLLAATLLPGVLATTATASASAAQRSEVRRFAVISFHKNYRNTLRSELVWKVYRVRDGQTTTLVEKHWRAGSGANRHATNSCRKNVGWLPDGWYRPRLYTDYPGNLIKGRAILLGRKACGNGTMRTDLFIHTEQGPRSVQCPDRAGDQACRWEYPRINDYRSLGCIKLAPADMRELYDAWTRFFGTGSTDRVRVRVA